MADKRGSSGSPRSPRPRLKEARGHSAQGGYRGRSGTARREDPRKRREERPAPKHTPVHLSDEVVKELHHAARPGKAEILVQVFSEAMAAFAEGDLEDAIRLGEQAKHIALRSVNAREFLGLAYYNAGQWREASRELAAFRRISGSNDQNPVIADCYRATGKPDKALEWADQVDPRVSPPEVYYEAAIVGAGALADMGRVDEAVVRLERLELDPAVAEEHHLRAWYVLGDLLERKGRFTQARRWFEAIENADPDLTDAPERAAHLRRA